MGALAEFVAWYGPADEDDCDWLTEAAVMQIKNSDTEKFPGKFEVIDVETGEEIENIAWADDEAGTFGVFAMRGRTLADAKDADLRLYHSDGKPRINECKGEIEIVDLNVDPFKAQMMALLRDPDIRKAVVGVIRDALNRNPALFR